MTIWIKQLDQWGPITLPRVLIDEVWTPCKGVFVNIEGVWNPVWMRDTNVHYLPVPRRTERLHDVRSCAA